MAINLIIFYLASNAVCGLITFWLSVNDSVLVGDLVGVSGSSW